MGENPNPPQPTSDPSQASPPVQPEGAPEKRYFCDSPTPDRDLPAKFAEAVNRLEGALGLPVWLLVQDGGGRSDWDYISVGEEYARRLLAARLREEEADDIARQLVEKYPEHGFIIDFEEAVRLGLRPTEPSDERARIMEEVAESLGGLTAIGRIRQRGSL